MKLSVHCFAENAQIAPPVLNLTFREYNVQIIRSGKEPEGKEQLLLKLVKTLDQAEIDEFKQKQEETDDIDIFFTNRSRKYEEALREVAYLIEGLLAVLFGVAPPKFDTSKPMVNLIGECQEEFDLLDSDGITQGFGYLSMPPKYPLYQLTDQFSSYVEAASNHLPALSFLSQAKRSYGSNDHEIAFSCISEY